MMEIRDKDYIPARTDTCLPPVAYWVKNIFEENINDKENEKQEVFGIYNMASYYCISSDS